MVNTLRRFGVPEDPLQAETLSTSSSSSLLATKILSNNIIAAMVFVDTKLGFMETPMVETHTVDLDGEAGDCCVICLDRISEQAVAIPCQHQNFDFLCLLSWFERHTTCPLCKAEVTTVKYNSIKGDTKDKTYHVPKSAPQQHVPPREVVNAVRRAGEIRQQLRVTRDMPRLTADQILLRRRQIYRKQQYSRHVGSNRVSRFRDLTPRLFIIDSELVSRARMWIRRELRVFEFLHGSQGEPLREDSHGNAEFLLEYIISILKTVDTQGSSGQAEELLKDFLGRDNANLFLHELRSWLRSPYTILEDWDRHVQYAESNKLSRDVEQGLSPTIPNRTTRYLRRPSGPISSSRYRPYGASRAASSQIMR